MSWRKLSFEKQFYIIILCWILKWFSADINFSIIVLCLLLKCQHINLISNDNWVSLFFFFITNMMNHFIFHHHTPSKSIKHFIQATDSRRRCTSCRCDNIMSMPWWGRTKGLPENALENRVGHEKHIKVGNNRRRWAGGGGRKCQAGIIDVHWEGKVRETK